MIPVDMVVDTKIEEIKRGIKQLSSQLGARESFRITIEARDSPYSTKQLIDSVADLIDNKVDLEAPDKIVFVQVFGEYTGLSVLEPDEVLSIVKIKRGI
jgi:tRNA acetyltransferase TAN1